MGWTEGKTNLLTKLFHNLFLFSNGLRIKYFTIRFTTLWTPYTIFNRTFRLNIQQFIQSIPSSKVPRSSCSLLLKQLNLQVNLRSYYCTTPQCSLMSAMTCYPLTHNVPQRKPQTTQKRPRLMSGNFAPPLVKVASSLSLFLSLSLCVGGGLLKPAATPTRSAMKWVRKHKSPRATSIRFPTIPSTSP